MVKSSHVPSQYLGYSIQATRMVCLLIKAPAESAASIEVFDDVGVTYQNGSQLAQQIKSTTSSHNPISDFSIELWKTFYNWLDSIEKGELLVDNTFFEIYVSRPQNGDFAKKVSAAKNNKDIEVVFSEFEKIYTKRKNELSDEVKNYIEKVLNFDRSKALMMFQNFSLVVGTGDITSELVETLRDNKAIPSDIVDDVGIHLLGWVKKTTDKLLQSKKHAIVKEEDFRGELQAIIRKLDRANILNSFAPNPAKEEIEGQRIKTYVLQLSIIEESEDTKLQAINDYLKAAIDRAEWAKKGLVSSTSFEDYEKQLKRIWNSTKSKISLIHKDLNETETGKLVFLECSECKTDLQGLPPPSSFISGSFHTLADTLEIGWHPFYEKMLEEIEAKELY